MRVAALVLAMLLAAAPAKAGVAKTATRAAFGRLAGPLLHEGFEQCARTTTVFAGPLDAAHASAACGAGAIVPGLQLSDAGGAGPQALYLASAGYASDRSRAIGQDGPAADALRLDFARPTRAVGFDIYQNFGGGAQLGRAAAFGVWVYGADGILGAFRVSVPSGHGAFFGAVAEGAGITRVEINNPRAYDLIDNIAFASARPRFDLSAFAAPAPEPAAGLALLGLGVCGIMATRRR